jgi:acyl-CoA thioester hydrolase
MCQINKKIYYHDTDCGGVVYYANYLKYFEEGRTEFFEEKGFGLKKFSDTGMLFVVRGLTIDYKSPACYGDTLTITTIVTKIKNVTLEFTQTIKRDQQLLVKGVTNMVCINKDFKPHPLPEEMIDSFKP